MIKPASRLLIATFISFCSAPYAHASEGSWAVDFFDDFDRFDPANWQDQMLWVNNEPPGPGGRPR